jgi:hypothetical protein
MEPSNTDKVRDFGAHAIEKLDVPAAAKQVLIQIQSDVADAYREGFLNLSQELEQQRSILRRIQETMAILVQHLAPQLPDGRTPVAFTVPEDGAEPDLAQALVIADPIGSGFTLAQKDIAARMGLTTPQVSVLLRAFGLDADPLCAVVVRKGTHQIVNYHRRVLDEFRRLIITPPPMDKKSIAYLTSARKALNVEGPAPMLKPT